MPCKAGYPKEPCPFSHKLRCTRELCGACKNFSPPVYILTHCTLWDRDQKLCLKPRADCKDCPERMERVPGRIASEEVDWSSPKSVLAYLKRYRAAHPEGFRAAMEKFKKKHPDYFETYRAAHREQMRATNRRYYYRKRQHEQSKGKI